MQAVEVFRLLTGNKNLDFPRMINKEPIFQFSSAYVTQDKIFVLVGAVVIFFILNWVINHTKLGLGIRAVSQDERTSVLMGVNVNRVISYTFLIGGILAGSGSAF